MIMTHVTMSCDTEAEFERLKKLSAAMLPLVRAEPGCVASYFAVDVIEPRTLHGIARYRDQAALNSHILEPATQRYMEAVRGLSRVVTQGVKYEVACEMPMMSGDARGAFEKLTAESS